MPLLSNWRFGLRGDAKMRTLNSCCSTCPRIREGSNAVKNLSQSRCSLSLCVGAILLANCGGSEQPPISALSPTWRAQSAKARSAVAAPRHHHRMTFNYTGAQQNFTVPNGVTHVTVRAYGGSAGSSAGGGYVKATIPVMSGESLAIVVGGNPSGSTGGFNGGGNGGNSRGYGGGGASDVRQGGNALANRVIVAGGGGGAGKSRFYGSLRCYGGAGGAGGGLAGSNGVGGDCSGGSGGGGGGQSAGGSGGSEASSCDRRSHGQSGTLGIGGAGGRGCGDLGGTAGGGGGGGYYGGGGGGGGAADRRGAQSAGGGGGGGSSYMEPSAKNVINQQGGSTRGVIIISW